MIRLALMIQHHRAATQQSVRALAKEIGIKYGALYRFEQLGLGMDSDNLAKVLAWALSDMGALRFCVWPGCTRLATRLKPVYGAQGASLCKTHCGKVNAARKKGKTPDAA